MSESGGDEPSEGERTRLRYRMPSGEEARFVFRGPLIEAAELLEGGRVVERVELQHGEYGESTGEPYPAAAVYRDRSAFRELRVTLESREPAESFSPDIWLP